MKPTPPGWPRMSASLYYQDPRAAIDWIVRAFGFEARLVVEGDDGAIHHSELVYGDALVMVGDGGAGKVAEEPWRERCVSPRAIEGRQTAALAFFVDDADAHCKRAREAGATIVREPATNDYGDDYWADRSYGALDCEGHLWWFMQRVRSKGEPRT